MTCLFGMSFLPEKIVFNYIIFYRISDRLIVKGDVIMCQICWRLGMRKGKLMKDGSMLTDKLRKKSKPKIKRTKKNGKKN